MLQRLTEPGWAAQFALRRRTNPMKFNYLLDINNWLILLSYLPLPSMIYIGRSFFSELGKDPQGPFQSEAIRCGDWSESSGPVNNMESVLYQHAWGHFHSVLNVVKETGHADYNSARNELNHLKEAPYQWISVLWPLHSQRVMHFNPH